MIAGIKAENGTWHLLNNGGDWIDTQRPVHYDMWNHLQLVLGQDGTLQAAAQPVGQVAALIGSAKPHSAQPLNIDGLTIDPSTTAGHLSCYDNLVLTSGPPARK